jgi:hypothetical protein
MCYNCVYYCMCIYISCCIWHLAYLPGLVDADLRLHALRNLCVCVCVCVYVCVYM